MGFPSKWRSSDSDILFSIDSTYRYRGSVLTRPPGPSSRTDQPVDAAQAAASFEALKDIRSELMNTAKSMQESRSGIDDEGKKGEGALGTVAGRAGFLGETGGGYLSSRRPGMSVVLRTDSVDTVEPRRVNKRTTRAVRRARKIVPRRRARAGRGIENSLATDPPTWSESAN